MSKTYLPLITQALQLAHLRTVRVEIGGLRNFAMVVKHFDGVRVELRRVSSAFCKVIFQIKKGSKLSPFLY